MKFRVLVEGQAYEVDVEDVSVRPVIAYIDGERVEVWPEAVPPETVTEIQAEHSSSGNSTPAARPAMPAPPASTNGSNKIAAPIPGVIDTVQVQAGDTVKAGQVVCTLEAMKMKNIIRASHTGTIAEVHVAPGQTVNHGDVLITFSEN